MIQAVNMAGSSIYTLLALIAIVAQSCPLASAKDNDRSYPRRHGGNANINTNINTFHKSRRLYETMARNAPGKKNDKAQLGKEVQTAIIATAAADAAKAATRSVAKKLSENTADAVASAVVRVLSGEDADDKAKNVTEDKAIKAAARASKYLHEALNRLMYRNERRSGSAHKKSYTGSPRYRIKRRDGSASEEQEVGDEDESQYPENSDEENDEDEPDARQYAYAKRRFYRRFLDHPNTWKNHYRRSAIVKPVVPRNN